MPENTLASIGKAAELGCAWIEADACLLGDGELVLFHDDTLDRCTDGTGFVREKTLAQMQELDAGSWFGGDDFKGEYVPLLSEALTLCQSLGLGFNIELKVQGDEGLALAQAVTTLMAGKTFENILISSFDRAALAACELPYPKGLICTDLPKDWQDVDCQSVHLSLDHVKPDDIDQVKSRGREVYIFTLNDKARAQDLYDQGVDGVFSDYPDRLIGLAHPHKA